MLGWPASSWARRRSAIRRSSPRCRSWFRSPSDSTIVMASWPCTAGPRGAAGSSTTRMTCFPTAAAFVITDIARDGMLTGPDLVGPRSIGRAGAGAGHRQRRRGKSRRHRGPCRDRRARRHHHRQGVVRRPPRHRRSPAGAGMKVARVDPVSRRHRGSSRQGHELRRPARCRRSRGVGGALRHRRRRRVGVPRHHRVERQPGDHGRHGPAGRRAGVHPVHGRRWYPFARPTPGRCCAPGPTRSA